MSLMFLNKNTSIVIEFINMNYKEWTKKKLCLEWELRNLNINLENNKILKLNYY